MATNNGVNLNSSGIVKYNGSGTFSSAGDPLNVADGGTGAASFTAYSVICAGTTGTGAFQNVSGVGSSSQVLLSNGTSALPSWAAYPMPVSMAFIGRTGSTPPSDGVTYYLGFDETTINYTQSTGNTRIYMPKAGIITKCLGAFSNTSPSSNENVTIAIRLNDTSNTTVTSSLTFDATSGTFSNTSLSINVVAGDYIDILLICPTWSSNPGNVGTSFSVLVT